MVMVGNLRLFATLQDGNGGLAQVYCDGHQRFVFERTDRNATVVERLVSTDPRDFHDYTKALGDSGWSFAWVNG